MNAKRAFKARNATYQTILYGNIQALANFVIGKSKSRLDFDVPPLMVKRNDFLVVQQLILSMTPDERMRLDINKSTLWYQKEKDSRRLTRKDLRQGLQKGTGKIAIKKKRKEKGE